jgi:hypothetical protein
MLPVDWARAPPVTKDRCFAREIFATTMSSMNSALRNSNGTSIIVQGLRRAEAEDKECNRRKGAAGAVNSENIQDLSLRTSQPSVVNFDDRITIQPKIAARPEYKSSCICVDLDFDGGLVKTSLWGGNHFEFILNRM